VGSLGAGRGQDMGYWSARMACDVMQVW
jgi:hypothetical protein